MNPPAGARFGPYEIRDRLGRGGMGLVYRAWDGRLCRDVAIKLLVGEAFGPGGHSPLPGSRERFLQEARAASALNHPNICTIFDIGEKDGAPYLVMELMEGETLGGRLARGALSVEEIVQFGTEVADALAAAHARGIIHRDIKPANIFLVQRPDGGCQTKVLDFGLAKVQGELRGRAVTTEGVTVGTVAYMAPEQARGQPLDARADLFSLGVVLYEMATARVPFAGSTNALTFVQLLHHEPEPVRDWNETVPRALEKIIGRLLEKDPAARFQTAAEVGTALRGVLGRGGLKMRRPGPVGVPLVRTVDPVARERRPVRRRSDPSTLDFEAMGARGPSLRGLIPVAPRPSSEGSGEREVREARSWIRSFGRRKEDAALLALPETAETAGSDAKVTAIRAPQEEAAAAAPTEGEVLAGAAADQPAPALGRTARQKRRRWQAAAAAAALLGCVAAGLLWQRGRAFRHGILAPGERLLLLGFAGRPEDAELDDTLSSALALALAESRVLRRYERDAVRTALRQPGRAGPGPMTPILARQVAQTMGARVYAWGAATRDGPGYVLALDLVDAPTGRTLRRLEEKAAGGQELLGAVDRLGERLRQEAGEPQASLVNERIPLQREATPNLEAMHAYALGATAELVGQPKDAITAFTRAVKLDPAFVAAELRLAWLYAASHEEQASAAAARLAEEASDGRSQRTRLLAEFCYAVQASGDLRQAETAIRRFAALYPHDPEAARGLARLLGLQGRFSDALDVAERGIAEDPYDADLYAQAESALLAMDRYDAALGVEQQSRSLALPHAAMTLTAAYLAGKQNALSESLREQAGSPRTASTTTAYGLYLDNTGQIPAGAAVWAREGAGLVWRLSQGAMDRALAGDCGAALTMVRRASSAGSAPGRAALFAEGMAAGLCSEQATAQRVEEELLRVYGQASDVSGFYLPELRAAQDLAAHSPQAALDALRTSRPYDSLSLTPYLRGLAHAELREYGLAEVDLQAVLGHRGIAVLGGSNVYPMAQLALARAYAASGDRHNSALAQKRLAELWPTTGGRLPGK